MEIRANSAIGSVDVIIVEYRLILCVSTWLHVYNRVLKGFHESIKARIMAERVSVFYNVRTFLVWMAC